MRGIEGGGVGQNVEGKLMRGKGAASFPELRGAKGSGNLATKLVAAYKYEIQERNNKVRRVQKCIWGERHMMKTGVGSGEILITLKPDRTSSGYFDAQELSCLASPSDQAITELLSLERLRTSTCLFNRQPVTLKVEIKRTRLQTFRATRKEGSLSIASISPSHGQPPLLH